MSRLTVSLAVALLFVELTVAAAVILTSDDVERPWLTIAFAGSAGTAFVVSGLIALNRRPENRVGAYLLATGYLWLLSALADSSIDWVAKVGIVLSGLVWMPFTALVLAYPTGRLTGRLERALPVVVGVALAISALAASFADPEPADTVEGAAADSGLAVADVPSTGQTFDRTTALVGLALIVLVVAALIRRWRYASPALRWQLWPVAGAGAAALVSVAIVVVADQLSEGAAEALRFLFFAAFAAVPVAFLFGLLRVRLARSSATELLVEIQRGTPLREALARALGDPGIEIAYPLDSGSWVDSSGRAVSEPVADGSRAVKEVLRDGGRIATLRYDSALDAEPEFLDAIAAAAGIALQNERLQAELRAEIDFMSTVTNTAPSLLVTIDTDGRIRTINRAALEAAGYSDEAAVRGRYYWDLFIDPREREAMIGRFRALAPDYAAGEYENTFTDARGEVRTIYWRTAPVTDAAGTVVSIVSGGADITMRRRRELELERERDVQSAVFQTMPSIMVVLARDGTILDRDANDKRVGANRAFKRAVRWADEELVGRPFLELVVEDDDGRAARAIAAAAAGEMPEEVESALLSSDGTSRVFTWSAIPVADVTGRRDRIVLICGADITERKQLELENERERAFLNAIANNAPSLLCLIDADGVVTHRGANIAFEHTLEYDPDEIGGQVLWDAFVDPVDRDAVKAVVEGVARGEQPKERDHAWVTKTGRQLSMAWSVTPLPVIDERTLFLFTAVDITERKRIAEDLRASRARLIRAEDMARRALERNLHDGAQQRLVALSVSLRLLESRLREDPDGAADLLAGAQTELTHALAELRELARGIHPAVLTDRGLRPALETLVARAPIPVELTAPDERLHPDVEAAAYYVVAEALTNVAKYARASSARVCASPQNGVLVVTVADDGAGGADPAGGSGLRGLADRIAAFDGTLAIESPPGKGTSIRAEIPLAPQTEP
ncbi:MAG TPA: PAS domain S-box protein [Gaiellaceae bacterium]|nr:PAS domain S-box protein [Gaiellaceae bacterium]